MAFPASSQPLTGPSVMHQGETSFLNSVLGEFKKGRGRCGF